MTRRGVIDFAQYENDTRGDGLCAVSYPRQVRMRTKNVGRKSRWTVPLNSCTNLKDATRNFQRLLKST